MRARLRRLGRAGRPLGWRRALISTTVCAAISAALITLFPGETAGQFWGGRGRGRDLAPSNFPPRDIFPSGTFSFVSMVYESVRSEALGIGWGTDYPGAGYNFMTRLEELTTIKINKGPSGEPQQYVVRLTDPELFDYPFIFTSDVGTAQFSPEEQANLRSYLLRGGFLWVDDFWGTEAWKWWEYEIGQVLPPEDYPIRDVPLDHEIFNIVFEVKEVPQIPSIQWWESSGGVTTSERGFDSEVPHLRGIWDKNGRLMVLMSHNTDIADGWEREGVSRDFFDRFSLKSYPIGINIIVYVMTH